MLSQLQNLLAIIVAGVNYVMFHPVRFGLAIAIFALGAYCVQHYRRLHHRKGAFWKYLLYVLPWWSFLSGIVWAINLGGPQYDAFARSNLPAHVFGTWMTIALLGYGTGMIIWRPLRQLGLAVVKKVAPGKLSSEPKVAKPKRSFSLPKFKLPKRKPRGQMVGEFIRTSEPSDAGLGIMEPPFAGDNNPTYDFADSGTMLNFQEQLAQMKKTTGMPS